MMCISALRRHSDRPLGPLFRLLLALPLALPVAARGAVQSRPGSVVAPAALPAGTVPAAVASGSASSAPAAIAAPATAANRAAATAPAGGTAPSAASPTPAPAPAAANAPLAAKTVGATKPDTDVPGPDEDRADAIARDIALHPPQKPMAPHAAFHLETQNFTLGSLLDRGVRGAENTEIGHVVDVLIGTDGKPSALELDVGGFMGLGNRRIAVAWNLFDLSHPDGSAPLRVALSEAEVRSAPATDAPAKATVVMGAEATSTPPAKPSAPPPKPVPAPSVPSVPAASPAPNAVLPSASGVPAAPGPVPPAASTAAPGSGAAAPQSGDNMPGSGPGPGAGSGSGDGHRPASRSDR